MDKVYAVSEGEYSYYTIHAVFPSRTLAESHMAEINADKTERSYQAFVEEFRTFDRLPVRLTWYELSLRMNDDGSYPPEPKAYKREGWEYAAPDGLSMRPQTELLYSQPYTYMGSASDEYDDETRRPGQYGLFGHCLDERALVKVASDAVAQWKAQGYRLHNAKPWT